MAGITSIRVQGSFWCLQMLHPLLPVGWNNCWFLMTPSILIFQYNYNWLRAPSCEEPNCSFFNKCLKSKIILKWMIYVANMKYKKKVNNIPYSNMSKLCRSEHAGFSIRDYSFGSEFLLPAHRHCLVSLCTDLNMRILWTYFHYLGMVKSLWYKVDACIS
mgnify:CR=1 FL=1